MLPGRARAPAVPAAQASAQTEAQVKATTNTMSGLRKVSSRDALPRLGGDEAVHLAVEVPSSGEAVLLHREETA